MAQPQNNPGGASPSGPHSPGAVRPLPPAAARPLPPGTRMAAVVSTYHAEICGQMLASARAELERLGLAPGNLLVVEAPGAFELALIARRLAVRDDVHAVLCLGLVLKGETSHDQHVAAAAARGILRASLETDKPVLFGVLTCDTLAQAQARALPAERGGNHDKGREVARAAVAALFALEAAGSVGRAERPAGFALARDDAPGFAPRTAPPSTR